ncbi:CGNR zinc finger domain-containing protein, partial [Nonomuraea sp. NPDC050536]|uniref:CGNR zinc finger domain-containing protein n=1 Tax=Nonomuraea sp. NPDC050536 TaxID=3364366 RepID=UPI0037C61429
MIERPPHNDEPLTGEHLALDFINTLYATGDHLATLPALHHWLTLEAPRLSSALPQSATPPQPTHPPEPDTHRTKTNTPSSVSAHRTKTDTHHAEANAHRTENDAHRAEADARTESDGVSGLTEADAEVIRGLRAHVSTTLAHVRQGAPPPPESLEAITEAQHAAPTHATLTWANGHLTATTQRQGTPGARLAAQLADAAIDLLTGDVTRIRQCEGHDCVMLFIPAHPRRRWCSTTTCGNRARVARHYARHKS